MDLNTKKPLQKTSNSKKKKKGLAEQLGIHKKPNKNKTPSQKTEHQEKCYFCGNKHKTRWSNNINQFVCIHCWSATIDPSTLGYATCSACGNLKHITRHNPDLCYDCIIKKPSI